MELEDIRKEIDEIDNDILRLLEKRIELARKTKELKKDVISFSREEEIYSRLQSKELSKDQIKAVFSEIISASRKAQQEHIISYLGPEGSFSHLAALKKFGNSATFVAVDSFEDVFKMVLGNQANFCIMPIENSLEGSINTTLDILQELGQDIRINSEIHLRIVHNLLTNNPLFDTIYSHPQALSQCKQWLKTNYPVAKLVETASTSKAAELAKIENQAAISSSAAADKYGLNLIYQSIEDNKQNITRFIILGRAQQEYSPKNKTSLLFSVQHKAGALFDALEPFKKNEINLTKIESRPSKKNPFEYVFFVDLQGNPQQENVKKALEEMQTKCMFLKILGSYPEEKN